MVIKRGIPMLPALKKLLTHEGVLSPLLSFESMARRLLAFQPDAIRFGKRDYTLRWRQTSGSVVELGQLVRNLKRYGLIPGL